jgi:plasmid stabilization system protein ParE
LQKFFNTLTSAIKAPRRAWPLTSKRRLALVAQNKHIGRPGRISGTRELVLTAFPYIIAYRVTDRIEILAMMHGARRWPDKF